MLNSLQPFLSALPAHVSALDVLLPKITHFLQENFIYWVDGGAGVGTLSTKYAEILDRQLDAARTKDSSIFCYDPLPENIAVLHDRLGKDARFIVCGAALSNHSGEAVFFVPSRITSEGAGPWAVGTSFDGSLKHAAEGREKITVRTVRLDEENIPRFDFVKMDLQGGETDALMGMGERMHEAKILYVETQLLHDWGTLRFLLEQGFVLFFDRLQLGFRADLKFAPLEKLKVCGISIDRMCLPQSSGMPLVCWGHFDPTVDVIDPQTLVLRPLLARMLLEAGVSYLQTDTICVNKDLMPRLLPLFLSFAKNL